jgi:hypothetical protein
LSQQLSPLAERIIRMEREHRRSRRPAGPALIRNAGRRGYAQPLAIYVTWLDELPGARR